MLFGCLGYLKAKRNLRQCPAVPEEARVISAEDSQNYEGPRVETRGFPKVQGLGLKGFGVQGLGLKAIRVWGLRLEG